MRSIESQSKFIVDVLLYDQNLEGNELQLKVCDLKFNNEHSYGEKIKTKYTLKPYCGARGYYFVDGNGNPFPVNDNNGNPGVDGITQTVGNVRTVPCPFDLTLCTEICGNDVEFGKVSIGKENALFEKLFSESRSHIEGIKLLSNFNGINFEIVSGKAGKTDASACLDLWGADVIAITACGDYCDYSWEVSYRMDAEVDMQYVSTGLKDANGTQIMDVIMGQPERNVFSAKLHGSMNNYNFTVGLEKEKDQEAKFRGGVETNMNGAKIALGYDDTQAKDENKIAAALELPLDECSTGCLFYKNERFMGRLTYE
jgi:hypothetical protein